jgi:outer membrane protein insertion porin family
MGPTGARGERPRPVGHPCPVSRAVAAALAAIGGLLLPATAQAQADPAAFAPFEDRPVTALSVEGNRATRAYVITRELETAVGRPFHLATLQADLQRLENLGLFAETTVEPSADAHGVSLLLRVVEMPPLLVYPSFIYTEENGFSYGGGLSAMNLSGRGINLSARAYFGGSTQRWARLVHPWIAGNHLSFEFFGGERDRADVLNGFEEDSWEFTPKVGTRFGRHGRLQGSLSLFRMRSDVDGKTLEPDNEDQLVRVGGVIGWDTRDSWRTPRHGWKNELELVRSSGAGTFWTMNLDVRRYQPTGPGRYLLLSGLWTHQTGTVGEDVPVYMTYYLGGANSIRGYAIEELGPQLNGQNQLLATAEHSFNLLPLGRRDFLKWSFSLGLDLAVFADAGIAWSESEDLEWNRIRGGGGVGLRVLVPGSEQVRFDLGWSQDGGFHFHFASGTKPASQRQRLR